MSLAYAGSLSIAGLCVQAFALFTQLSGSAQAQLSGTIAASLAVGVIPPTYAATIEILQQMIASLQAAIDAGITAPQVSAGAGLSAQIEVLTELVATFNAMAALGAAGGIDVWTWSGAVDALGPALSSALDAGAPSGGGPNDASNGLVLLTRVPATWTAMSGFFGGAS